METSEQNKKTTNMNKMLLILGGAIVILGVVGGVVYMMNRSNTENDSATRPTQQVLREIEPEDIGFTLEASADKQNVLINVTKPEGIKLIEYDLSYDAEGNLPRGTFGEIDIEGGEALPKKVYLGTCSSGTCKPDKGITLVNVTAKVTYTNGDRAQLQSSIDMTE